MSNVVDGNPAPDFNLPTDGDGTLKLSNLRGSPVCLFFYPKDDTPGCTKEAIGFTELKAEFEALGVVLVGMSPDKPAKHDKFKAKHNLDVTLVSDEEKNALDAYGVWVEKSMYGKKYMGVERSTFLIDAKGNVAKVWRKVKVPDHVDDVLASAKELFA